MTRLFEITDHSASLARATQQIIPRTIMQTFESRVVPERMYEAVQSWITTNTDYSYRFFDREDRRALIRANFDTAVLDAYDRLDHGSLRADLWRYCALWLYGGVYADIDFVCVWPLQEVIRPSDELMTANAYAPPQALLNGFIASIPQHPFLEAAIRRSVDNVLGDAPRMPMALTGPVCFGEAVNVVLGRDVSTGFEDGDHFIDGVSFRLLTKVHTRNRDQHRVVDGHRTLFMCKYVGYESDLRALGLTHWQKVVARKRRTHVSHWYGALARRFQRLRKRLRH